MEDFEKLGAFYLGRPYDLEHKKPKEGLLLYDSKDLVTHAVCVGMTGSGKTGLCITLLEERLRYGASHGCTVAMMVTQPGSGSQRNAERHGFRIAYTRTKWQLQGGQKQHAGL